MKYLSSILPILFLIIISPAFAQTVPDVDDLPSTGVQPDSPFWGLDVAIDKLRILIASTPDDKSRVGLEIAHERLLEINEMINQVKPDHAFKATEEHDLVLMETEMNIERIHDDDPEDTEIEAQEELEDLIEMQERVESHKLRVDEVKEKVRVILQGNQDRLSENEHVEFERVSGGLDNAIESIEIKIKDEKTEIQIHFENDFGKTSFEFESEVHDIEDEFEDDVRNELSDSGKGSFHELELDDDLDDD